MPPIHMAISTESIVTWAYLLSALGNSTIPCSKRPGRFEPRVRKKRGSNYNLMMRPREVLRARLATGDNSFETK
ncbi:hypothetical protein RBSH_03981 [Rhodopirellula baltica SH28]|uniref:Uncharacterized protein n=1 Tax=Rhodopirellula baltica SH28 TaxID=993517 RepID=K5DEC3_RHOBT|nr:hypothetical protein RBSH_03981 [Rhodopirellula baltica SH28]